MKRIALAALLAIGFSAGAIDLKNTKEMGSKAMAKGQDIFAACKKEQMEMCPTFKDLAPLKECLTKNKEKLSPECKKSVAL